MRQYSVKLKQAMAAKILSSNGPSALSLAGQTGISQTTLSKWARQFKMNGGLPLKDIPRRPKDWSKSEKFHALLDSANLQSSELGAFLRKKGITSEHLEKWKKEFLSGDEKRGVGRPTKDPELKGLEKENKELKRELHRKDKALAEAAALIILKKKAQGIWGDEGDEK